MNLGAIIQTIAIYALPVLFAITLHEAAHGYVARHYGDLTAYAQGRISLNPLRHIDLVGTVIVPLVMIFLSGFIFGWAKPVPVNYSALRHPKQDMVRVAAAGPAANLAMAIAWALILHIAPQLPAFFALPLDLMAKVGIRVNLIFMFLNLLPILPLDGGRIVAGLLPSRLAWRYAKLEPWGFPLLIVLLMTNVLGYVLGPLIAVSESVLR